MGCVMAKSAEVVEAYATCPEDAPIEEFYMKQ
jgi:hypothetical protein